MFYEVVDTLCNWHITFSGFYGSSKKAFVHKLLFLQSTFSSDNVIRVVMSHMLVWKLYDLHTKAMLKVMVFRLINNSSQMTWSNN